MITTFYSYKGGVGRTSLAVETAARLAMGGSARPPLRVVLWDLDLEAPGVHYFPVVHELSARAAAGTIDLLDLLWSDDGETTDDIAPEEIDAVLRRAVVTDPAVADGRLGVLAPNAGGALDRQRLIDLDLPKLFSALEKAPSLLRLAAERLRQTLHYDAVVIDARTGVSDLAATATMGVPDTVVFVLRMDEQDLANIEALLTAIRAARADGPGESEFHVVPVATFVPDPGENVALAERLEARRRELVTKIISPSTTRRRLTVEIPFRKTLLIDESVPSLEDVRLPAAAEEAYERLAEELALAARPAVEPAEGAGDTERGTRTARPPGRAAAAREAASHFVTVVTELLQLDGWTVAAAEDAFVDLQITRRGTFGRPDVGVVQCKTLGGRLDGRRIREFVSDIEERRTVTPRLRGLVVSERGFTAEAVSVAEAADVDVATPDDLLTSLAPLDPVRTAARRDWENTDIESRYVPLMAVTVDPATARADHEAKNLLEDEAMAWLRATPSAGLLAILGDFGSGKSTFVRRFAYQLATEDSGSLPVALVVDLKTARSRTLSAQGLIAHALASAGMQEAGERAWHYRLTHTRTGVLVVDGFDEMLGYTDPPVMRELIAELLELSKKTRVILTSRTNYFISHQEAVREFEAMPAEMAGTELWKELTQHPSTQVLEILPFSERQVHDYLERLFSGSGSAIARRLEREQPLGEIARRPYLLKLVAGTVEQWERDGWPTSVNLTELYEAYVAAWELDRTRDRVSVLRDERAAHALDVVARAAWAAGGTSLTSKDLTDIVRQRVLPAAGMPAEPRLAERMTDELRTATFLSREGAGDRYAFVHSSFLEFFVARGIARAVRTGDPSEVEEALDMRRFSPEVATFLLGWSDVPKRLDSACKRILRSPYRSQVSENALLLAVHRRREFAPAPGANAIVKVAPGLELAGAQLSGADLVRVDLTRANLKGARLDAAQMTGAILREARLDDARLDGAVLTHAVARRASFRSASARNILAFLADFQDADFTGARLDGSSLGRARLARTRLTDATLAGAHLDDAALTGADFNGADLRWAKLRTPSLRSLPDTARTLGARVGWPSDDDLRGLSPRWRGGHHDWVRDATVFTVPEGTRIATASDDGTVRIWDVSGAEVGLLGAYDGWVKSVAASELDGMPVLITGTDAGDIRLWDLRTSEVISSWSVGPDEIERMAAVRARGRALLAAAGEEGVVRVWDLATAETVAEFRGHESAITGVCLVEHSEHDVLLVTSGEDTTVRVWAPLTGTPRAVCWGHDGPVTAVAVEGGMIASGGVDGTTRLWSLDGGQPLATVDEAEQPVTALTFITEDETRMVAAAVGDGDIRVREIHTDAPAVSAVAVLRGHGAAVAALATVPTSYRPLLVSAGSDRTIRMWDPITGQALHHVRSSIGQLHRVCVAPVADGMLIAASDDNGNVATWDALDGRHRRTYAAPTAGLLAVASATAGSTFVATGNTDGDVVLWDVATGVIAATLRGHTDLVRSVCSFGDRRRPRVATASDDETVRVWNPRTGEQLQVLTGHEDWVRGIAVAESAAGPLLVSGGDDDSVRVWNARSGDLVHVIRIDLAPVLAVAAYSENGRPRAVTAGYDTDLTIWDLESGLALRVLEGHQDAVRGLKAYQTAAGYRIASGSDDGTLRIWDPLEGSEVQRLTGSAAPILALDALPLGRGAVVATCSADGIVRVWDPDDGRLGYESAIQRRRGDIVTIRPQADLGVATDGPPAVIGTAAAIDAAVIAGPHDGREIRHVAPSSIEVVRATPRAVLRDRARTRHETR